MLNKRCFAAFLFVLAHQATNADAQSLNQKEDPSVRVPRLDGEYVHIYRPSGDVFPGPSAHGLKAGQYYEE
jgi:hypothetical protein